MTTMTEETKNKLNELEQRLRDKGVVDFKFSVDRTNKELTSEQLGQDLCEVLEAYFDGNYTPCFGIGDSNNPEVIAYFAQKRAEYEQKQYADNALRQSYGLGLTNE